MSASEPAAGKPYIMTLGIVLSCLSFAEIISSIVCLVNSSGHYVGGIYSGIVACFLYYNTRPTYLVSHERVGYLLVGSIISVIVCFIAIIICGIQLSFVQSLEACGSFNDNAQISVTGNSDYYPQAKACDLTYLADNDGYYSTSVCNCVSSQSDSDCYEYDHMASCSALLNATPNSLAASLAFCVLIFIVNILLCLVTFLARYHPEKVRTAQEREELNTLPTVSVANSTVTTPIVAATIIQPINTVPATVVPTPATTIPAKEVQGQIIYANTTRS